MGAKDRPTRLTAFYSEEQLNRPYSISSSMSNETWYFPASAVDVEQTQEAIYLMSAYVN